MGGSSPNMGAMMAAEHTKAERWYRDFPKLTELGRVELAFKGRSF